MGCAYGFFLRKFPEEGKAMRQQIIDWYVAGKIKPAIGHLFSLEDAPLAMKEMEERRIQGKALVGALPGSRPEHLQHARCRR